MKWGSKHGRMRSLCILVLVGGDEVNVQGELFEQRMA